MDKGRYLEINSAARLKAGEADCSWWEGRKDEYEQYRALWRKADEEDFIPDHPLHIIWKVLTAVIYAAACARTASVNIREQVYFPMIKEDIFLKR